VLAVADIPTEDTSRPFHNTGMLARQTGLIFTPPEDATLRLLR